MSNFISCVIHFEFQKMENDIQPLSEKKNFNLGAICNYAIFSIKSL